MSSPSVQAIHSSDPSIPVTSDPSIRVVKKTSRWLQFALIFLVFFALAALVLTIVLFIRETNANKQDAASQEAQAREIKRINANPLQSDRDPAAEIAEDDDAIFFSLFSTPAGADVYRGDTYFGTTPINQKKIQKTDESSDFVIVLDGYELMRRNISLKDSFSDSVTLEKIVVQAAAPVHAPKQEEDAVTQNKAVIVTAPDPSPAKKSGKKKKGSAGKDAAVPVDMGIALPD